MYDFNTFNSSVTKVAALPMKTFDQIKEVAIAIFLIFFNTFMQSEKILILPDLTGRKPYTLKHAVLLEYFKGFKVMVIDDVDLNFTAAALQPLAGGETVIMVNQVFLEYFTEKEQNAILCHEVAHIKLRHLDGHGFGFMNSPKAELEADRFAAKTMGQKAVISFIRKMVTAYISSRPEIEHQVREIFAPRLAALGVIE